MPAYFEEGDTPLRNDSDRRSLQKINQVLLDLIASFTAGDTTVTPATTSTSAAIGSTTAGKRSVTFILSSDFAGTINSATYAGTADAVVQFEAPVGTKLSAISWTRTAGSLRIIEI